MSIMDNDKLLVCSFDNGVKTCDATVYNFYPVLVYLDLMEFANMPELYTICWIRDYVTGETIDTKYDLLQKLDLDRSNLRISFFSSQDIKSFSRLIKIAQNGEFPPITYESAPPLDLTVYTIWWYKDKPKIIKSGVNKNPGAVIDLFQRITLAYVGYYAMGLEKPKRCGYSSGAEDDASYEE